MINLCIISVEAFIGVIYLLPVWSVWSLCSICHWRCRHLYGTHGKSCSTFLAGVARDAFSCTNNEQFRCGMCEW